jgi:hypothetical protein
MNLTHAPSVRGSLLATLGSIKELPKPQGRFARAARTGKLCPFFAQQ